MSGDYRKCDGCGRFVDALSAAQMRVRQYGLLKNAIDYCPACWERALAYLLSMKPGANEASTEVAL